MKGFFINNDECLKLETWAGRFETTYVDQIMSGMKTIETRSKNMLHKLVGERVAVVSTGRGRIPLIVGTVYIRDVEFIPAERWDMYREETLVPRGSKHDCRGKGKWGYILDDPKQCYPRPLPANAVRHGRSWCEFEEVRA